MMLQYTVCLRLLVCLTLVAVAAMATSSSSELPALAEELLNDAEDLEDEIARIVKILFVKRYGNPELTSNEALDLLQQLEPLLSHRATAKQDDRLNWLVNDVRTLIGYSKIADDKCIDGSAKELTNPVSYYRLFVNLIPYWDTQAKLQVAHCGDLLLKTFDETLDAQTKESFQRLAESVKQQMQQAQVQPATVGQYNKLLAKGLRSFLEPQEDCPKRGSQRNRANFDRLFDEHIVDLCGRVTGTLGPMSELFRNELLIDEYLGFSEPKAYELSQDVAFCYRVELARDDTFRLYMSKSILSNIKLRVACMS